LCGNRGAVWHHVVLAWGLVVVVILGFVYGFSLSCIPFFRGVPSMSDTARVHRLTHHMSLVTGP